MMQRTTLAGSSVTLRCVPGRQGEALVFPYTVQNDGAEPVYVMDAIPGVDPATRNAVPDDQFAVVIHISGEDALVARIPPLLPADRVMLVLLQPLVRRLDPGEALSREVRLRTPFAESNPYLPELLLRQYEPVMLARVTFAVAWWPVATPGIWASPAPYAPDYQRIQTDQEPSFAFQRFPVKGLQLFRRLTDFPRNVIIG